VPSPRHLEGELSAPQARKIEVKEGDERREARGEMRQEARPTAVALCSPGVSVCQRVSEGERFGVTMFEEK